MKLNVTLSVTPIDTWAEVVPTQIIYWNRPAELIQTPILILA